MLAVSCISNAGSNCDALLLMTRRAQHLKVCMPGAIPMLAIALAKKHSDLARSQVNICPGLEAKQNALIVPYASPEFVTDQEEILPR